MMAANIRGARWSADGDYIDAVVNHPEYGWIPMALRSDDPLTAALYTQASEGEVAPYVEPPPAVPHALTRLAFKAVLLDAGLLDGAEAVVAQADALTRLKWAEATSFARHDPIIDALGQQLGLAPAQIDQMYIQGAALESAAP